MDFIISYTVGLSIQLSCLFSQIVKVNGLHNQLLSRFCI